MYRFVLSRRWVGFALAVLLLAAVCVRLGVWQFDRLGQRWDDNEVIRANLTAPPVPVHQVDPVGGDAPADEEWQRVTATGTYDVEHQTVVRYQTRDEGPGVNVVTPLVTQTGTALLVDRGWLSTPNRPTAASDVPAPASGVVTVTGWLRVNSTADADATTPADGSVRAISSTGFAETVPYALHGGYVQLLEQDPPPTDRLVGPEEPDTGQGPHFFYGLQWIFFAALALFGWAYFAWSEAHPDRRRRTSVEPQPREPVRR